MTANSDAEFDEFGSDYRERLDQCVRLSGQDADYFAEVKADALIAELHRRGVDPLDATVLDFGCGNGGNGDHLAPRVGRYVGTDVAGAALRAATPSADVASFVQTDDVQLPFRGAVADAILVSCVLHHIDLDQRRAVVDELRRLLRPGGFVFVVEHNPFNPATRWIVNRCEFDRDAVLLRPSVAADLLTAGGLRTQRRTNILFLPGKGKIATSVNRALRWLPMGAQYSIAASANS